MRFLEIPVSLEKPLMKTKEDQAMSVDADRQRLLKEEEKEIEQLSSWLWFEFTPYEVGCDELGGALLLRTLLHALSNAGNQQLGYLAGPLVGDFRMENL